MVQVLAEGAGELVPLLGASKYVSQVQVDDEEADKDLGLDAQAFVIVHGQEAFQVGHGLDPLAFGDQVPQMHHRERSVRLAGHPASDQRRRSVSR